MIYAEIVMPKIKISRNLLLVALGAILFVGCRAEEQGRIIRYEPGVYKGQAFSPLSNSQRKLLRRRTVFQGSGISSGGAGGGSKNVRRPTQSEVSLQKLKNRVRLQSGTGTN
jgi:hypothetical protein